MIALYILLAIVVLLFMITVHELGHYIAGKILKFKINEFSIGFGPAIFSRTNKKNGEKFSLRIFPLGGYCAFDGEDEATENSPTAFSNQKPWKRIIVLLGGVTMNFLTAVIFSWILLCTIGYDIPQVSKLNTEFPNQFQVGDVITEIDGQKIDFAFGKNYVELLDSYKEKAGYEKYYKDNGELPDSSNYYVIHNVVVERNGKKADPFDITIYPKIEVDEKTGENVVKSYIGIETKAYVFNAWEGFCRMFQMAFGFAWVVLKSLWMLITFQMPIKSMTGTIGTITTMATLASKSMSYMLIFIPLIAANLAVFNLLPIPALDGAHVMFTTIEWIRRKPINKKVENTIHFVGLIVLLLFVVVVDILHFVL